MKSFQETKPGQVHDGNCPIQCLLEDSRSQRMEELLQTDPAEFFAAFKREFGVTSNEVEQTRHFLIDQIIDTERYSFYDDETQKSWLRQLGATQEELSVFA